MRSLVRDARIVMTLDADGTSFRFCAMRGGKAIVETVEMPSCPDSLNDCLLRLVEGFKRVLKQCPEPPVAISFAFPGPADYSRGIIGNLGNLPCFQGGVALGPILEDHFSIPVFINNDGDLFTLGEAINGFLPHVNTLLELAGSQKSFSNLLGITIGTGLGGGIVRNQEIFIGDNSSAGHVWLLRNKLMPKMNAEESASCRALRRFYAERAGEPLENAPPPEDICEISLGKWIGNQGAAIESFQKLGEAAGDAIANALALVDGLAVIGGGLVKAAPLFLPALVSELNGEYELPGGKRIRRLVSQAFNLEDSEQLNTFLKGNIQEIEVQDCINFAPRPARTLSCDMLPRVGIGISRLGTSEAIALGAYAFALRKLDHSS